MVTEDRCDKWTTFPMMVTGGFEGTEARVQWIKVTLSH